MNRDTLTAAARHAAAMHNLYHLDQQPPEVTEGPSAACVTLSTPDGFRIVAIHANDAADGDWHLLTGLAPHTAATLAAAYARAGL